ncbi:MAG: SPOR domain-containing protein [Phycisphaerae bacterium]|nr:SPOR domain-containing protein [Phycisphaerae bacterium]
MRRQYRTFAVAMLCVAGTGLGCNAHLSLRAKGLLHSGNEAYKQGDYQTTVAEMDAFVKEVGRSRRAGEGYYLRALAKLKLNDTKGAKVDFDQAADRTADTQIRSRCLNALGDIAWDEDDMDQAARCYAEALESTDRGKKPADHSQYRLGCVLQRQGKWHGADLQFSRLDYFFRGSELAMRAARRINCRAWTVQAGAFDEKGKANSAAAKLQRANLSATVEPILSREKLVFVVQVGRYAAYEQAVATLEGVRQHVDDAFVITTR